MSAQEAIVDEFLKAQAVAAGLDVALRDFPGDVEAAAAAAGKAAAGVAAPTDPRAEPWPPMVCAVQVR